MPPNIDTLARQYSTTLPPEGVAALVAKVRAKTARLRTINEHPTPLDLACRFDPTYVRTPALELVADRLAETIRTRDGRLIISIGPQQGKALDCDTPILTTAGWSAMGDLQVGDEVFHPDGHPTPVVAATEPMNDRPCYRVTTSDGRSVVADAEHLWTVRDVRNVKCKGPAGARPVRTFPEETLTTQQLLDRGLLRDTWTRPNGSTARSFAIRLPQQCAVVSKPVDLPLDPYLFGAWLGDGTGTTAELTVGTQDLDHMVAQIEASGSRTVSVSKTNTAWRVRFNVGAAMRDGFNSRCARLGVWGNKHIPDVYSAAGTEQRLALLQGLLDTDGSIFSTQTSSRVEFTACRKQLAEDVLYLVRSLGWRATVKESAATLDGREVGRRWRVCFTPQQGDPMPFRLARKAVRVQVPRSRAGERNAVSIASIEPVASRPVRCIKVEREDGLFLAGRDLIATHNTSLLRWMIVWALIDDPDRRIVFASYAAGLARTSGRAVRGLIGTHGPAIGLAVSRVHADAADWELEGHKGGMFSTGRGAMTGRPSDWTLVDDPLRDQQEADSPVVRGALHEWWDTVARTRLAPGAPVVVVQTRWAEDDLAGRLAGEGWPVLNIPAQADGHTLDALGRPPGEWLVSARGTTAEDWVKTRKDVGERAWASLYQGRPAPLEGGVFKSAWFDTWRVAEAPEGCLPPVVVVDPADGGRDEAGVILAAKHATSGRVYILDDFSGNMTIARWARLALLICARRGATAVAYEKSLSQLPVRLKEAWATLHQQATALRKADGDLGAAHARLSRADDSDEAGEQTALALAEVAGDMDAILAMGMSGPSVKAITPRGSKTHRMMLVAPAFETGRAVMVGAHSQAEWQLSTWQAGQDSPDRADAIVHAVALLSGMTTASPVGRADDRIPTHSTSLRSRAGSRITRSTGR